SKTTEDDYRNWLRNNEIVTPPNFDIAYFHLGGDLKCSAPTKGKPEDASRVLKKLVSKPSFLMVGTLEPRKGHQHIIEAFSILWSEGIDVNLVIVGKVGWNIATLLKTINSHSEFGQRLIWLQGVSDEY